MMKVYGSIIWLFLGLLLASGCGDDTNPESAEMPLSPAQDLAATEAEHNLYTCGMHPHIVQEGAGQCPICSMNLTPMKSGAPTSGIVEIDPVTMQNIGVRTVQVIEADLRQTVRANGEFVVNEQAQVTVSAKISGWVEKLYVDFDGARVQKGRPLLEIYSPELVATQEEYVLARRNAARLVGTAAEEDGARVVAAAARRLAFWDITADQIAQLEATGQPQRTLTLYAPASGTVVDKTVFEGQHIQAGETLLQLVDLQTLWLMVDVFEQDLGWVQRGTEATIELPFAARAPLHGQVDFLYDVLHTEMRTVKARIRVPNPDLKIKPGMYGVAVLQGAATGLHPVIPEEALIRTGTANFVILVLGQGRFRPVEVDLGTMAAGQVQLLEGWLVGEEIVTRAQFLIDSEARLRSALGAMQGQQSSDMGDQATLGASLAKAMEINVYALDENGDGLVFQCLDDPDQLADTEAGITDCSGEIRAQTIGAAQTVLHYDGFTQVPIAVDRVDENGDGHVYQCPMDWAILHDHEGRCEVCGMNLTAYPIATAKANLEREGYHLHHD